MEIPKQEYCFAGGVTIRVNDVDPVVWQAHVIKHPLGLGRIRRGTIREGTRRWNAEGWDRIEPPVVSEPERVHLVQAIQVLEVKGARCGVRDLGLLETAGVGEDQKIECYSCVEDLAKQCVAVTGDVGSKYARHIEEALCVFDDASEVTRLAYRESLSSALDRGDVPSVAAVGDFSATAFGLRVNCANGVRVEAYADREHWGDFHWKTTYRVAVEQRRAALSAHLAHLPRSHPNDLLSEKVLVPRLWWERNSK